MIKFSKENVPFIENIGKIFNACIHSTYFPMNLPYIRSHIYILLIARSMNYKYLPRNLWYREGEEKQEKSNFLTITTCSDFGCI